MWEIKPFHGLSTRNEPGFRGENDKDVYGVAANLPMTKTATVRVGIATGPWKTVAESQGRGGDSIAGTAIFSPTTEKDDGIIITVSHSIGDQDVRITAMGLDGREYSTAACSSGGGVGLYQITATLSKFLLKDVKTFRLQTRRINGSSSATSRSRLGRKPTCKLFCPACR